MDLEKINQYKEQQQEKAEKTELLSTIKSSNGMLAKTILATDKKVKKVKVLNDLAKPQDIQNVVNAVNKLGQDLNFKDYKIIINALNSVSKALAKLPTEYPQFPDITIPEQRKDIKVTNLDQLKEYFNEVVEAVNGLQTSLKLGPKIEVKPADVIVQEKEVDLSPLKDITKGLDSVAKAVKAIKTPKQDNTELLQGLEAVKNSINGLVFPTANYVLPFKDVNGKATQVQLDSNGNLPITSTSGGGDGAIVDGVSSSIKATVKDLTNSNPLTVAITDANGDQITTFGGGVQYTEGDLDLTPTGTAMMFQRDTGTGETVIISDSNPLPVNDVNQQINALTDAELRATPVPVSGTITANAGTGNFNVNVQDGTGTDITSTGGALDINISSSDVSLGGGTQYTEGDVDASITGTALMMEGAGNALVAAQGTAADGLLVNLGTNNDVTVTGTVTANLAAGTNNIGDVDVLTLPVAYNAGTTSATTVRTVEATAATSTLSNVAGSASSVTLIAANTARKKVVMYNDSTADCYVKYGSTASSTSFTWLMAAGSHIEETEYNGIITGIWTSATGNMRVSEIS